MWAMCSRAPLARVWYSLSDCIHVSSAFDQLYFTRGNHEVKRAQIPLESRRS